MDMQDRQKSDRNRTIDIETVRGAARRKLWLGFGGALIHIKRMDVPPAQHPGTGGR
jgi:hypothetical protein